jgi:MYXO-CTERM domain-containing protein
MQSQIAAGASTSFTVAFDPSSVGTKDAYVQIAHTDGTQPSPFFVPVTGVGVSGPVPIMSLEMGATLVPDGGSANAGPTSVGSAANLSFIITNYGTANLNLTGVPVVAISNQTNCAAAVGTAPAVQIAPSASTTFALDVTAAAPGAWSFEVSIANDDLSRNPYNATISGTGVGFVATEVRVLTQPVNAKAGKPFPIFPIVAVTDASGTIDVSDNSTWVQVEITTGTGNAGAFLGGTVTKQVSSGIVQFDDLEIDKTGQNYTLTFSDLLGPLTSTESDPFNVTKSGGGGDEEEEPACSSGPHSGNWLAALGLLSLAVLAARRRRA